MSLPQLIKHKITAEDYHKMIEVGILTEEDKVELINGEIVLISPKGSRHSACISKIYDRIGKQMAAQFQLRFQDPILVGFNSEPEPDLALVKAREDFYVDAHPLAADTLWVIEVAESSLEIDRTVKMKLYAEAGIAHYWIINLRENCVEMFAQPKEGLYAYSGTAQKGDQVDLPYVGLSKSADDFLV